MKRLKFILLLFLFGISCSKDSKDVGDLNVRVLLNGFQPVDKAQVYTNPASKQGITDGFGSVLLTDIETGSYEVYASLENVGSGKSVVSVKQGELSEVIVNITPGVNVGLAPVITLVLPSQPAEYSVGEDITFSADVKDDKTQGPDIKIEWKSNLDGVLNTKSPSAVGNCTFATKNLSKGLHQITLTAKDADGYSSTASLQVSTLSPKGIVLADPVKSQGKVSLQWTAYPDADFVKYEVFRSDGDCSTQNQELLASITDKATTTFTDHTPPFEFKVCYFVRVTNTSNNSRNSNQKTVDLPGGHIFNFEPYDMMKHPDQTFVYLLDQPGQRLLKFDYSTLEVVKETSLQGKIGHCDIGDNGFGVEIYAPSEDGWIYVYDADDLSLSTTINTGLRTGSVVINGLGHVIASVSPSPWWEQPVRTYSRASGILLDGNGGFELDRLRRVPGKNEVISISTSVSPIDMEYFRLTDQGLIALHQDDQYHGDYPLDPRIFRISDSGVYTITSREGAVYLANSSMVYKGQLQHGALAFSDFAFSEDGSIIYAATSNRKSIQIGRYPALTRDSEILTKGFPVFILRAGDKIIALSKSSESSINTGIEVIDL